MRSTIHMLFVCAVLVGAKPGAAQDLRLAVPPEMAASGFLQHILPRFKLKHRIAVLPVGTDQPADMAFVTIGPGTPVFASAGGTQYRLVITAGGPEASKFQQWLQSEPGKAAITGFPRGGPPAYVTDLPEAAVEQAPEITGDAALGSRLALVQCGRCHVVDKRNRMGGIGSTPSFAAMRGRSNWFDLFSRYWTQNPHPSFTEVVGVTEPFGEDNVTHIAPVQISLDEIDAIVAFVETLTPLDLGRPLQID